MKQSWKKERAKHVKHARLMRKQPALREALYGTGRRPPDQQGATRETAQKDNDNG